MANTVAACGTNTKVTGSTCLCDDGSNYYLNSDYTCKTTCDATWPFMSYTTPNTCSVDCGANK